MKSDLQNFLTEHIGNKASPLFMGRASAVIEDSKDDKESLLAAWDKVCKMISLFIDKRLGHDMYESLKGKI